jgi:hypothetical protein
MKRQREGPAFFKRPFSVPLKNWPLWLRREEKPARPFISRKMPPRISRPGWRKKAGGKD